jgi:hypothetical protein
MKRKASWAAALAGMAEVTAADGVLSGDPRRACCTRVRASTRE